MALLPCITKAKLGKDVEDYLHQKAKEHIAAGLPELEAYRKAARDLQEHTLNTIHDIYHQAGVTGYEEPAIPIVSEKVKNKFSQFKNKQNASTQSAAASDQTTIQPSGKSEYARTEQARSESEKSGAKSSDSNIGSQGGQKEVTKKGAEEKPAPLQERLEKVRKDLAEKAPEEKRSSFGDKKIETDKAVMEGYFGDKIEMDDEQVTLPKTGFVISDVALKEGEEKGKGSGQEIYKQALDKYGTLYSNWPVSEDALRAQDALVKKGLATVRIEEIGGNDFRVIEKSAPIVSDNDKSIARDTGLTGIEPEEVRRQMQPITDKMAEIEMKFKNEGLDIDWDYDNEIIILDKNGEMIAEDEIPKHLRKDAENYADATLKLAEYDHKSYFKSLQDSRKRINGDEIPYEEVGKPSLPASKPITNKEVVSKNEDVSSLRNANSKEEIQAAILKATQSDNLNDALDNAEGIIGKSMYKAIYYTDPKKFANELADSIEQIIKNKNTEPITNKEVQPSINDEFGILPKLKRREINTTDGLMDGIKAEEAYTALDLGNKPSIERNALYEKIRNASKKTKFLKPNGDIGGEIDVVSWDKLKNILKSEKPKTEVQPSIEKPPKSPKVSKPKPELPKEGKRIIRDAQVKKDIDNAWDEFTKGEDILTTGGLDPKKIEAGTKLIGLYIKQGVYKFADILEDAYGKFGDKLKDYMDALKSVYLTYYGTRATDEEAAKMDLNIRQHTFGSIKKSVEEKNKQPEKLDGPRDFIDAIKGKISGKEKLNIVSIRKLAAEAGIGHLKDTELQEMTELGIVELAKNIVNSEKSQEDKFKDIVDLYNSQPTISMRSSERIEKQQYSTPVPIAFSMGEFINAGHPELVLEPNAGNGMLTINIPSGKVIANEIDPVRLQMLSEQGFKMVTANDATKPFPHSVRGLIMNPPFGASEAKLIDGVWIRGLDEQMIANALQALKNDGRAAIIMGGHNEYDEKGRLKKDRVFLNYLHNRYNVKDVINVDGSLYAKQGTSFPVRVILIDGAKAEKSGYAPLEDRVANEPVKSFEELNNRIKNINDGINNEQKPDRIQSGVDAKRDNGDIIHDRVPEEGKDKNQATGADIRTGPDKLLDTTKQEAEGKTISDDRGFADDLSGAISDREREFDAINNGDRALDESREGIPGKPVQGGTVDEATGDTKLPGGNTLPISDRTLNILEEKAKYQPKSQSKSVDTVMPSQMAQETYHTLDAMEKIYGNLDDFVTKELGYSDKDKLFKALSAEQVDAVAIAIHQLKSGQGMIVGDMTGVGKGRIAAAIVRYAVKNGYKPIFLTEKPNLFSDLHRDMIAIGSDDLTPFIVNDKNATNNPDITNEKGEIVHRSFGGSQKKGILYGDRIPDSFDYTVATYSQFRKALDKPSVKRDFFLRNAMDNILIMDESHNASGESNSGAIFQDILPNTKGVVFLSATFAKRPDNMPVYAMKTAMADANMSKEELVAAIQRGGTALQEVVAANLVQSGQMIRRERDFSKVEPFYNVLEQHKEKHTEIANSFTSVVRDVIDFEKRHIIPLLDDIDSEMAAQQGTAVKTPGTRSAGISNVPFASKTFNLINQMLFSIKAKEIAEAAIKAHKEGFKPVIGFLSTMESFLNSLGVTPGEKLDKADFAMVLKKALDGTMKYTIRDGAGNNIPAQLSLSELTPEARTQYDKILKVIRGISSGISISPIDVMTKILTDAGLRVGEITGRKLSLEMNDDGSSVVKERKNKDINKISRGFNNGDEGTDPPIDVILLNASGATGISLHSSKDFKDQRPRKLISGQLELDINKEIQKRGRVDRTGQLHRAAYEYIVSAIPAEQRLLMMFKQKLKSLDANTTSSQKSKANQLDIADFLNKYGDEVVTNYLKENSDFNEKIQDPFDFARMSDDDLSDVKKIENAASKVTGRVAILPTNEQETFYKDIIEAYTSHMNYLKDNNENDLEVKMLPLNATTTSSQEVIAGRGTNSPFGMPSTREKVEVDVLTKPLKKAEIDNEVNKSLGGKTPKESKDEILKELDSYSKIFTEAKIKKIEDAYTNQIIPETLARLENKLSKGGNDEAFIISSLAEAKENLLIAKENKIDRERQKYENVFYSVEHNIKSFSAGDVYAVPMSTRVDTNTGFSKGIFMGFQIKEGATNKYTPSNIVMRFAVNDSRRVVSVPLSKTDYINAIIANSRYIDNKQDIKDNWDSKISNKTRATRYIITGNLLQAYGTNDGQLVSYTTDTGAIRKGMLLPDSYDAGKQKFRTTISQALTDNDFNGQGRRRIVSTDGDVTIDIDRGDFTVIVPLSKQRGGKYFLEPKIRDLVVGNDFHQYGGKMEAAVNADNLRPLLAQLDSMGVTVESEMGDNKNRNYQVKTPENDEVSQMKEVVQDLINEGTTSLKQIQAIAENELGQNMSTGEKAKLNKLVEDAYNEATKEVKIAETNEQGQPIKNELTSSFAKRINSFVDHIFGKNSTESTVVLKDSDAMRQKAQLLGANKFQGIEVDDMIRYNKALEPYEDENWDIKKIPELYKNGKLDKDLLGGLMMFKAPQYMLFGTEGATEAIDFLKDLNGRLKDSTLADTINFLESQKPFLEDSDKISDTAFAALDKVYKTGQKIDWFSKEASKVFEASSKASSANLLKAKAEVLFTNYVNHTYDAIFDKYITNEGENSKEIPQKLLPKSESDEVLPFMNENGEILGFTHNGKIYLNGEKLNPNTPVHEAGHIWTEWAKTNAQNLYKRGIELINGSDYLAKTKANKFYQAEAAKLPEAEREQYFQHEALAAAIGDKGAQFITEAKRNSFIEWAKNLWDKIAQAVGFKGVTADELQNMTFDDFTKRAAVDILKGKPEKTGEETKPEETKPNPLETGETDQRRFTKQVLGDEAILPKPEIAKKLDYVRQTNAVTVAEANRIIDDIGVDAAFDLVVHDKDLNGAVRAVMGQTLIKKFNTLAANAEDEETGNYYIDKTIETADYVTEHLATESGRIIQSFNLYSVLSPEAQMRSAIKDVKAQAAYRTRKRAGDIKDLSNKIRKVNEDASDELINSKPVKVTIEKTENSRVARATDKIQKARDRRKELIEEYKAQKGSNLYSAAPGLTKEGIEFVGNMAKTYIDEGLANLDIIAEKIKDVLNDITAKPVTDEVNNHINSIVQPLVEKIQNQKITIGLKDLEKSIHQIIKEHYTIPAETKSDLIDNFMDQAGLEKEDARELANSIQTEFDKIATRKKEDLFEAEKSRFNRIQNSLAGAKKPEPKSLQDDLIKLTNLGGTSDADILKMLQNKLGTGALTPEQGQRIQFLAERIENAPEGSPKREAVEDLLSYRAKLKGTPWAEVAQGVWYANILSGYLTHIRNIVSTFYNGMAFFGTELARDPKSLPFLLYGGAKGLKRGGIEAWHTLTTGRSPIHVSKVETPNILERINFKGGLLNPANYLKYVSRLMIAEDVLQFQGLKEMRATQLAYREAKMLGHKNPFSNEIWKVVNEKLLNTPERLEAAKDQANDEGLFGVEAKRRIYELMELSRPIQMQDDAYGFAAKGTFNHETEGTLGALSDWISTGLDKTLSVGGAKPLRFLVPFTRIITNVANNTLDFSPVGLFRGAIGVRGLFASKSSGKRREMTPEERRQTLVKSALGIASMAGLYALAQNGIIQITGAGPSDYRKKLQLIQEGWQPYSIKIGDKYYSYKLTPMVFAWGLVGSVMDHQTYDKDADEESLGKRVSIAAWDGAKSIGDMTWVSSAAPIMSAFSASNPGEATTQLSNSGKNIAKGFVLPNAYTQTAEKLEQVFNVPQKQVNGLWGSLITNVPIARNSLNDKINALGDPVIKDVDILSSEETKDPVWKYLLDKKGWVAPVNKNTIMVFDQKTKRDRPITEDEYYEFSKVRGHKIKADIEKIMAEGAIMTTDEDGETTLTTSEDVLQTGSKNAADLTTKELNKLLTALKSKATKATKKELHFKEDE